MTEREISHSDIREAYKQAYEKIPERWYENRFAPMAVAVGVSVLAIYSKIFQRGEPASHLAGAAIYALSTIAEGIATLEALSAQDKGVKNGFPRKYGKKDLHLLTNTITAPDYRADRKIRFAFNGIGLIVSTIFPEVGMGLSASNLTTLANNYRKATRHNEAIKIATSRAPSNQR